jgi:hypothetical protein
MLKLVGNHDIECSNPSCASRGATSAKGELPTGWGYRLALGDDDEQVRVLPYCPACTKLIPGVKF